MMAPQTLKDILNGPHEYVNGAYRPLPPKPEEEKKVELLHNLPQGAASKEFLASMEKNRKAKE